MNREIKFRVWDNYYKYMNYKVLVGMWGSEDVMNDQNYTACSMYVYPENVDYKCEPHWTHFEPYHKDIILMQYTGLKDKNGVEIYEGDICLITMQPENFKEEMVVIYSKIENGFRFQDEDGESWNIINSEIEVIGNIFERLRNDKK